MSGNVIGMAVSPEASKMQNVNFAVRASLIVNFLSIKGVVPNPASADRSDLSAPDLADIAKEFTVQVYCQKASSKTSRLGIDDVRFVAYNIADASKRFAGLKRGGIAPTLAGTRPIRLHRAKILHQLNED